MYKPPRGKGWVMLIIQYYRKERYTMVGLYCSGCACELTPEDYTTYDGKCSACRAFEYYELNDYKFEQEEPEEEPVG